MEWRKSSFSGAGNDCVELTWRKSSFSVGNEPTCVEMAWLKSETLVRDTKNRTGPMLALGETAWHGLLAVARDA